MNCINRTKKYSLIFVDPVIMKNNFRPIQLYNNKFTTALIKKYKRQTMLRYNAMRCKQKKRCGMFHELIYIYIYIHKTIEFLKSV